MLTALSCLTIVLSLSSAGASVIRVPHDELAQMLLQDVMPESEVEMLRQEQFDNNLRGFQKDPEIGVEVPVVIRRWGYPVETHTVETPDGYLLDLHRIPHGIKNADPSIKRPVVLLQHGFFSSSAGFVLNLPYQSLGFMFADAGYDVWMGNFRGNTYGRHHVRLNPKNRDFWRFDFDQMAEYDIPTFLNYITMQTRTEKIVYVGHSMGTLAFFALCSERPDYCDSKVSEFFALAPVGTVSHVSGALRFIAHFTDAIELLFNIIGYKEVNIPQWFQDLMAVAVCGNAFTNPLCQNALFLFGGPDGLQTNSSRTGVYFSHTPSGVSSQTLVHFGQLVRSGRIEKYDFGRKGNQKAYDSVVPPMYPIELVNVPTYLYYGDLDPFATTKDVEATLLKRLRCIKKTVRHPQTNHIDYLFGLRVPQEVYLDIFRELGVDLNIWRDNFETLQ